LCVFRSTCVESPRTYSLSLRGESSGNEADRCAINSPTTKPNEKGNFRAHVTIFGNGNIGTAIDELLTAGGTTVDHIGSADPPGPVNGDIVILAVYAALQDILREYGDKLAGKVVVDITNPVNLETFDSLIVAPGSSAAEELAAALPSSQVLKAFNVVR
jgi:predicted dinucleotide-binding enzyme